MSVRLTFAQLKALKKAEEAAAGRSEPAAVVVPVPKSPRSPRTVVIHDVRGSVSPRLVREDDDEDDDDDRVERQMDELERVRTKVRNLEAAGETERKLLQQRQEGATELMAEEKRLRDDVK